MVLFMALVMCFSVPTVVQASSVTQTGKLKQGKYTYTAYTTYQSYNVSYLGTEKTTIYKQKNNGKKIKLVTFSGSVRDLSYIYNNKLYFTRYSGGFPQEASIEYVNLKNKKRGVLKKGLGITSHKGQYVLATPQDERNELPVYVINMKTKKAKKITSKGMYEGAVIGKNGRIYYVQRAGMHGFAYNLDELFSVYSCKINGKGRRLEGKLYEPGTLVKVTSKYIQLRYDGVTSTYPYAKMMK